MSTSTYINDVNLRMPAEWPHLPEAGLLLKSQYVLPVFPSCRIQVMGG